MFEYERSSNVACSQQNLFEYHSRPGAINRLIPPWENISILKRSDSLEVGSEVLIQQKLFGIPIRWHAKHTALEVPARFQDTQISGPFKTWVHDHLFAPHDVSASTLVDRIRYEMKFGPLGKAGLPMVRRQLAAMFAYRHETTVADLKLQQFLRPHVAGRRLRIAVTGSTGLIGRRLVDLISVLGHDAIRILRQGSNARPVDFPLSSKSVVWDRSKGFDLPHLVEGLDAVVHLAGKSVASARWTDANKREMRSSRVDHTIALVDNLRKLNSPPKALVSASAIGIYGNRGIEPLSETSSIGDDYLAQMACDWEAASMEYRGTGNRVAVGRLGIALHPRQGALSKLLPLFKLGLGGPIGNGKQHWSWIHVDDAAAALLYLAINPACEGPFNLVAPEQTDNRTFAKTLGQVLRRPAMLAAPAFALRLVLGEMADAMLLASTRVTCERLESLGFPFRAPTLEHCLRHLLGRAQVI